MLPLGHTLLAGPLDSVPGKPFGASTLISQENGVLDSVFTTGVSCWMLSVFFLQLAMIKSVAATNNRFFVIFINWFVFRSVLNPIYGNFLDTFANLIYFL
ncbi:hypothetical protein D3C71_1738040 [compost metagenome]